MNNRTDPILYIVIPCYNEQEVLPITAPMFLQKINDLAAAGQDQPGKPRAVCERRLEGPDLGNHLRPGCAVTRTMSGICQSRNRGHQNAVLAGLMEAKRPLRHHDFHRLRRAGRHQRDGRHGGRLPRRLRRRVRRAQQARDRHVSLSASPRRASIKSSTPWARRSSLTTRTTA